MSLSADLILPTASVDGNRDCLAPCKIAAVVIIPCFQAINESPSCVGQGGGGGRAERLRRDVVKH